MKLNDLCQNNTKKTSIRLNDLSHFSKHANPTKMEKSPKNSQDLSSAPPPHRQFFSSFIPTLETAISASNISQNTLGESEEVIRRIVKEELAIILREHDSSSRKVKRNFDKLETDLQSLWTDTQTAIENTSSSLLSRVDSHFRVFSSHSRSLMMQIQTELKAEILKDVCNNLPQIPLFSGVVSRLNDISDYLFQLEPQKKPTTAQVSQIKQQVEQFSRHSLNVSKQINKIKSRVSSRHIKKSINPVLQQTTNTYPEPSVAKKLQFTPKHARTHGSYVQMDGFHSEHSSPLGKINQSFQEACSITHEGWSFDQRGLNRRERNSKSKDPSLMSSQKHTSMKESRSVFGGYGLLGQ